MMESDRVVERRSGRRRKSPTRFDPVHEPVKRRQRADTLTPGGPTRAVAVAPAALQADLATVPEALEEEYISTFAGNTDDDEGSDFTANGTDTSRDSCSLNEDSASSGNELPLEIPNEELASILPNRTIARKSGKDKQAPPTRASGLAAMEAIAQAVHPRTGGKKASRHNPRSKVKQVAAIVQPVSTPLAAEPPRTPSPRVTIEEIDDQDAPYQHRNVVLPYDVCPTAANTPKATGRRRTSPIYHFFKIVEQNSAGLSGDAGDIHYCCFHGKHKTVTVKLKSNSSQTGLIDCLEKSDPLMFRLYERLKLKVSRKEPPTMEELRMAAALPPLDPREATLLRVSLDRGRLGFSLEDDTSVHPTTLMEPWNQQKFEELLTEWIVASDQPFDEIEDPFLIRLLQYTHNCGLKLSVPSRESIRRKVVRMAGEMADATKDMFRKLEGGVSISLDAWSSSNGFAFLAIVVHYISNEWKLEEMLLDFRELIGEHSGENMADVVWSTLEEFGLLVKLIAIVCDNASNNDTLVAALSRRLAARQIEFSAKFARLRCFPHTGHLAACELLEAIGVMSKADAKTAQALFQETVTIPTSREADEEAVCHEDEPDQRADVAHERPTFSAIEKLRKIVRAIRSSPQRRAAWTEHVKISLQQIEDDLDYTADRQPSQRPLMLILDVRTR